jgi:hypothetical protein
VAYLGVYLNVNSCTSSTTRQTKDERDKQQLAKVGMGGRDRRLRGKRRKQEAWEERGKTAGGGHGNDDDNRPLFKNQSANYAVPD